MYLIHNTTISSLKSILKDGYLKSFSLLKKLKKKLKNNDGDGIYTENNFVYFSCVKKLFDKNIYGKITMYFKSKLLFNKSFYISTVHSPNPTKLNEWFVKYNNRKKKNYKKKYNKNYPRNKINKVLKKLYDHSISINEEYFQIFQQIAVRNKVNLKELVAIEFKKEFFSDSIINYITKYYINKYYPNVVIKII